MTKGYQSYRGRRSKGRALVIVLLVLIVAAASVYMYAQRFVVYRDDGSWYFDLPFLRETGEGEPPAGGDGQNTQDGQAEDGGGPDINLVVDQPEDDGPDEPAPAVSAYGERRLLPLAALPADEAALAAALEEAGANGFVYTIRDDTGRVFYDSPAAQAQAAQRQTSREALTALCAGDAVAVARFNCFHDSYYASVNMADAGICQSTGYIWSDERNYYWLDPAKEAARRYVIELALECAQMGFDELLLEEMAYPAGGNQSRIDLSSNTMGKSEALAQFLTELRQALELDGYDVKLSLLLPEELLEAGADETTGQDLTVLLPLVDAVYVPAADPAAAQALLDQYAGEGEAPALVVMAGAAQEGSWCLTEG